MRILMKQMIGLKKFMLNKRNNTLHTVDSLKKQASLYSTKSEFSRYSNSAYVTAIRLGIIDDICSHMTVLWEKKWDKKSLHKEALKYKTKKDFFKNNSKAYHSAKYHGILDEVCSHMVPTSIRWTAHLLKEEALKYSNISAFILESGGAYTAAKKMNIVEGITAHMISKITKRTDRQLYKIAKKYTSKLDFIKNDYNAYCVANNRGLLSTICKHMPKPNGPSKLEIDLMKIIKAKYFNAKTLHFNKISIENKPHIKKLEIDIFVPELNKGIEFDGKYWHSIQGLKRSHPTWPEEDIVNYHEIKDEYALSKGIKILHIKEKDWIKNKNVCIEKCLNFLSSNVDELA